MGMGWGVYKRGGWDTVIQPVDKTPYPTEQTQWSTTTAAVKIHPKTGLHNLRLQVVLFKPAHFINIWSSKLIFFGANQLVLAFLQQKYSVF